MQFDLYSQKLRILLSLGLLTLILVSGVLTGLTYAQISSSNSSLSSSYSKSSVVINFDPKKGQLPEGIVLDKDSNDSKDIFVSWAPIGKVAKIYQLT